MSCLMVALTAYRFSNSPLQVGLVGRLTVRLIRHCVTSKGHRGLGNGTGDRTFAIGEIDNNTGVIDTFSMA
jgi:hypothetical protein